MSVLNCPVWEKSYIVRFDRQLESFLPGIVSRYAVK